ncbi:hypothetical protein [Winogradskyella psychrotolerans]|uniref:hypothetical protein n=1 Tax=Winogradskyella psychrotolerans TaxID=1344585 RepID=UPI001C06965F|nr:hypothetical protein [Winogradskyella psychrotolerans]MBU2930140.1 hypothetical protein [Winogradskyella psychrotolerans]
MKLYTLLIVLIISISSFAQQGINYKALLKDDNGTVLVNQDIYVRFIIENPNGSSEYIESHQTTTDLNGIFILNIGEGNPGQFNDFNAIDWDAELYNLEVAVRVEPNGSLIVFEETSFKTVPYAKYAETAGNANWTKTGNNIENDNSGIVNINSTLGNPLSIRSTSTDDYIAFYNSGGYKGYTGIYTGNNDMDFGTGATNSTGKVHLTTLASPKLTVIPNGFVGIASQNPTQRLEVNGKIKVGNDAISPSNGTIRYNSTTNAFEGYIAETGWVTLGAKKMEKTMVIPATDFVARLVSSMSVAYSSNTVYLSGSTPSSTLPYVVAPLVVPVGSRLISISYVFEDDNPYIDLSFVFSKYCGDSNVTSETITTINTHVANGIESSNLHKYTYNINETIQAGCQYVISASAGANWGNGGIVTGIPGVKVHKVYVRYEEE